MSTYDKKTILLVEDEAIIAMSEKMQLEKYGYSVHHVTTGEKAVSTITQEEFPIDLILMDIDLGSGIDGTQAAEQILKYKDIPVVFLSSHTEPEVVEKTEEITSYGFVVKNSGIVVLDASIKMALKLFHEKTKRKQAEEALKEREEKINSLFNGIHLPVFVHPFKSKGFNTFVEVNNIACQRYGYSREEFLKLSPTNISSLEDAQQKGTVEGRLRLKEEGQAIFEATHITKYGKRFPVEINSTIFNWAGQKVILSVAIDITERKQAEEKLKESETRFRRLAETTSVAILIYQNDYFIYANPAAEMITGYRFDELQQMKFWTIVSPEEVNLVKERGQSRQRGESAPSGYEFKIITKQGEGKWVFLTGNTLELNSGKAGLITAIDITKRKQAEAEIKKQLSEKETLLREVHHRIKNNMASVEGLLSLQADSIDNSEAKAALHDSIARVQSTRVLYDKLLLGKEYHDISIKSYVVGLLEAISSVYVTGNEITIQKQITDFTIDYKKATSLGIIINELMTNVFKYAFEGCENGNVLISIERTENKAILIIQDNGIGIDERINLNKSPGLGLTLVKMLVEQLGGTFSIVNENGTKSTVQFEI